MYGTEAAWIAYASARGNAAPADAGAVDATAALTRASDYIRMNYVVRFKTGYDGTIPEVEEAAYIAASYDLTTPNFFNKAFAPDQQKVLVKADEIQWKAREVKSGFASATPISTLIEALLAPFTVSREGTAVGAFVV